MDSLTYLNVLITVPILSTLTYCIYRLYFDGLSRYPGPWLWALTNYPAGIWQLRGYLAYKLGDLHEKYGPVVRVGPSTLSYATGDAFNDIYGKTRPQLIKDPKVGPPPPNGIKGLAFTESDADHNRMRRNLSHGFSEKALREQEPLLNNYVDLMMQKLHKESIRGPVDMSAWFNFITVDIVGDLTFGESFHCLDNLVLHSWMQNIFEFLKAFVIVGILTRLVPITGIIFWMARQSKSFGEKEAHHRGFINDRLATRLKSEDPRTDFMTYVQRHYGTPTGMSIEELQETCNAMMLGGSETTASSLSGAVYHLLKNPSKLEKLNQEIRSNFQSEAEITLTSTNRLSYEAAVLEETLRVYPPLPMQINRITGPEGNTIAGQYVPGGVAVGVTHWACYHSKEYFKDPYVFAPERWQGDERYANDRIDVVKPFAVGPRNCIGYNLAHAEMKLILTRLLWNFDITICDESKDWTKNMKIYAVYQRPPLMVKLTPVLRG